ncbi:glycosyltransferase family 2 protein [Cellulomonas persica]|uniref:Succinoglycan biosynthesis protein exoa n=1 Tax=Cellulomonas persica TaxID=76861 RepID=A0A510URA2_9CELL|nr:glycosyltransferase family 2 protein [Cellulomonas persica]GEK17152.1 succinoglycan biosynthesis protein exoa [Cellulomonas persica]
MSPSTSPSAPDGTHDLSPVSPPSDASPPVALPAVSVFLTVREEERHLTAAVEQVLDQDYPGELEVVVAVGPSHDRTRAIADEIAARDPRVRVLDNPTGLTPCGLNIAVAAAAHDVLVRVDGHSEIDRDYVRVAVEALLETGAANVGGLMVPVGTTPFEEAVARAMSSRLGIGAASFHTGGEAGPAPTVYLGVFRRDALERVGGYDEHFVRAQDWELNHRLRENGEVVWFDPRLAVTYRPRGDVRSLARQFFRSGQWRRQVVRHHPETAGLRYLTPPAAVVGIVGGAVLGVVGATVGPTWLVAGAAVPAAYVVGVLAGSVVVGRGMRPAARLRLPAAIATMHVAWGSGFLRGVGREAGGSRASVLYPDPANASRPARSAAGEGINRHSAED